MKPQSQALAIATVIMLVLEGCAGLLDPPTASPPNWPDVATIRYSCSGPPGFLPALFDQPGVAELEDDPSAAALRDFLAADRAGMGFLPDSGWWLIHRDQREAQFITLQADRADSTAGYVRMHSSAGGWAFAEGGDCTPKALLEGQIPTMWTIAPGRPLEVSTTQFTAMISQTGCDSGDEYRRRLLPPSITYTQDTVFVVIAARPFQGVSLCGGMPLTPFGVSLREPLGDRGLLDAGVFPPGDANRPLP